MAPQATPTRPPCSCKAGGSMAFMRSFIRQLAQVAGDLALTSQSGVDVSRADRKGRSDYVSHVDKKIEETLVSRIHKAYPSHSVMGEEGFDHSQFTRDQPYWIIDPLDGTTNYLRNIPGWAISIAFFDRDDHCRHAVVFDPLRQELFEAESDSGAWCNGERLPSVSAVPIDEADDGVRAALPQPRRFAGRECGYE